MHELWATLFSVRGWVWDLDMPGANVRDELCHWKISTLVAVAMICKLLTEEVVVRLPLSNLSGNTLDKWVNRV